MGFVHSNGGQEPQDIGSVMTELNTINQGFEARQIELNAIVTNWRMAIGAEFTIAAERLESRLRIIEDKTLFVGLSGMGHVKAMSDLLLVFKNQRDFIAPMLADFPDTSAARLMVVLNKLISSLENQKKEKEAEMERIRRWTPPSTKPGSNPSRRTQAKQLRDEFFPPSSTT